MSAIYKPFITVLLLTGVKAVFAQSIVTQPPLNTFVMRSDLAGTHPRLYFTQADIATIRQRALGPCSWFYNKAKSDFGGYVNQRTPDTPGTWKDYLFGFWGQFAMCMFYLVEGDTSYANTARSWALFYAGRSDWLTDDIVPMEITSGMALTYDILYAYLTPSDRAALRTALKRSIDTIQPRFFVDQYWTNDYQNNHMHNRIHGLAHASFAIYGDDPAINVQTAADLAVGCYQQVVAWLPDDGSTHEGPGYWDYGYHWVVRAGKLISHVTGVNPTAGAANFANDYLYRLYMTTPGWNNTFNIGDADEVPPSNAEAWMPGIALDSDAAADSALRRLMNDQPGGFYQQTMWSLFWFDDSLHQQSYASLPLYRFWPDLEMFSVRSSWDDTATGFVFKCGPPGGNHMQQLRNGHYVNVAHDHPDQNHFLLFSNGRMLAQDDGYPTDNKLTRSHNTIVVDTMGQKNEGGAWYQPFDYTLCGHLDDVMLSGSSACAAGNASKLYANASRFVRHIAFIEGGYVVSIDDVRGAGTGPHTFDWRIHKNGTWTNGQAGEFFVADSLTFNMRLDIKLLEPSPASIQSSFLPVDPLVVTSVPCLSVKVIAPSTRISALLVPQHNGQPELTGTMLQASGGAAMQVNGPVFTDVFAAKIDSAQLTAGNITTDATHALVRNAGSSISLAMITRGTFLTVGGERIVRSTLPANCAWRTTSGSVTVEAEPSYKAAGGIDTIGIGGLTAGNRYGIVINGNFFINTIADTTGCVDVALDLEQRSLISITPPGSVRRGIANGTAFGFRLKSLPGYIEVTVNEVLPQPVILTAYALTGRLLKRWALSGNTHYLLPTKEIMPGVCLLRIENNGRSGELRIIRITR
jgi:hypothetical protein